MSPARRVPSHGTHLFGVTYAIDFVGVDDEGRSAPVTWRARLASEEPDAFVGFGRPILAPAAGTVVVAHDGEPDHVGRRSALTLLPYMFGQGDRVRKGINAIAGNHVVIALGKEGPFVGLVHLRRGSIAVAAGDTVATGDRLAGCGNSGNSTEPCVHLQVTDTTQWSTARGIPMVFRGYRSAVTGGIVQNGMPAEREIVESLQSKSN